MKAKYRLAPIAWVCTLLLFLVSESGKSQQFSENGWVLSPSDTLRILAVFAEIDYFGSNTEKDPLPEGTENWRPGRLPLYADTLFDPVKESEQEGYMTRYYREMSLGNLTVYGDYYPEIITIPYEYIRKKGKSGIFAGVSERLNADFRTKSNLDLGDFDLWQNSVGNGKEKLRSTGEFTGIDHVMIFIRNYTRIPMSNGQASASSMGIIGGKRTDSYSIFGAGHGFPFNILRHELNHLFIGGNNFHSGGGNVNIFPSYHFSIQGGWSLMGAANSSLQTCTGWDRYWLGWKPPGSNRLIGALNENGEPVSGDLDTTFINGIFILRDFLTTGDVVRLRLPFIPEKEHQQWIWIENHTTSALSGSFFDRFIYEDHDCVEGARPGLYLQYQIEANEKSGDNIYGKVYSDYLKPIPADGAFDVQWIDSTPDLGWCVNNVRHNPYIFDSEYENPLTGNHGLEFSMFYDQKTTEINQSNQRALATRKVGDTYERLSGLGHPRYGFREGEKDFAGIGTNPSFASVLTNINSKKGRSEKVENNNSIYLNGWSLRIIDTYPDGSIKIQLSTLDTLLSQDRRWAGPDIVLSNHNRTGTDLFVKGRLRLDRGETLTKFSNPDTVGERIYFTDPTRFRISDQASLTLEGEVIVQKDSEFIFEPGSSLKAEPGSRIRLVDESRLIFRSGAEQSGKGRIKIGRKARVICSEPETYKTLRKRTFNKKRVLLIYPGQPD